MQLSKNSPYMGSNSPLALIHKVVIAAQGWVGMGRSQSVASSYLPTKGEVAVNSPFQGVDLLVQGIDDLIDKGLHHVT